MSKSNKQLISFWNLIKRHKIVIPIIQRDYAQGRESEGALRKRFLNRLKKAGQWQNPVEMLKNYPSDK